MIWKNSLRVFLLIGLLASQAAASASVSSAALKKSTVTNLALGMKYTYSESPKPEYPDSGKELTDGLYASNLFSDLRWVGLNSEKTKSVVFDFGKKITIGAVKAHFLQDSEVGISYPAAVSFYVSDDGKKWGVLGRDSSDIPLWDQGTATTQYYGWSGNRDGLWTGKIHANTVYARFVKVAFMPDFWKFIDEIEIAGVRGFVKGAVTVSPTESTYLDYGKETGGISNLALLYNGFYESGKGDWTKENILPYLTYMDKEGKPSDWLFDGVLYLGLRTPSGHDFGFSSDLKDWKWYLDKTFGPGGDMGQLNEAAKEAAKALGQPLRKTRTVLMIPIPYNKTTDFGDPAGNGVSLNFSPESSSEKNALQNQKLAVKWYLDQVKSRWTEGEYTQLELSGMYWLQEAVETEWKRDSELIRYTSGLVHGQNQKFYWIPYFNGSRAFAWKELGFDAAALQPNHFFNKTSEMRISDAAAMAKDWGMGVEMELDERILTDASFRQRYVDYLNGSVKYGYQKAFRAYYQGNDALLQAARSTDPAIRELYDFTYQSIRGGYKSQTLNKE